MQIHPLPAGSTVSQSVGKHPGYRITVLEEEQKEELDQVNLVHGLLKECPCPLVWQGTLWRKRSNVLNRMKAISSLVCNRNY